MEVKIGVVHTVRELVVETADAVDDVAARVEAAVRDDESVLWITDTKGRRVGVPSEKIAYVELSSEDASRRVGFGKP